LIFSDEATFFLGGKVNRDNVRIWGIENPRVYVEHTRNSPKLNVFCALSNSKVYDPFFFLEPTVSGHSYLDLLSWPQRSPDITPCDCYLWGYVKDSVLYLHYRKIYQGYVTASSTPSLLSTWIHFTQSTWMHFTCMGRIGQPA
ncbi:hypothetical protein C0J52_18335, partial [Blattella germanica]